MQGVYSIGMRNKKTAASVGTVTVCLLFKLYLLTETKILRKINGVHHYGNRQMKKHSFRNFFQKLHRYIFFSICSYLLLKSSATAPAVNKHRVYNIK